MATVVATFEDFDAVVGDRIVGSGDVNGEIKTHFIEAIIDSGGGEDAGTRVFDAESFAGGGEVLENPLGGFARVASEEKFDLVAGVVDKATNNAGEEVWSKLLGFTADAISAEIFHEFLSNCFLITLIVRIMSSVVLPRERSARGTTKPCKMGPAMVKLPNCSRDL